MDTLRVLISAEQHAVYPQVAGRPRPGPCRRPLPAAQASRPARQRWCGLDTRVFRPLSAETRTLVTGLGAVFAFGALVGLVVREVPTSVPLLVGMGAVAPLLMVGAALGAALFLVAHRPICAAVALCLVALSISTQLTLYTASPVPRDGRDVVVMTANLHLGGADAASVVAAARRNHVDALMVQELTADALRRLDAAGLDRLLGHRVVMPEGGPDGTGLWSRYPLLGGRPVPGLVFATVAARAVVPGLPVHPTLVALHVASPLPASGYWRRDMSTLPAVLGRMNGTAPMIIGGDFNATPDVPEFRDLMVDGVRDAGDQAGAGQLRTWPAGSGLVPLIAIDHVLTRGAVGMAARTVSIDGTDHRALLTTVRIPGA